MSWKTPPYVDDRDALGGQCDLNRGRARDAKEVRASVDTKEQIVLGATLFRPTPALIVPKYSCAAPFDLSQQLTVVVTVSVQRRAAMCVSFSTHGTRSFPVRFGLFDRSNDSCPCQYKTLSIVLAPRRVSNH